MDNKLTLKTEFVVLGMTLSLEIGAHWNVKKSLKWFDFCLKFCIS